MGFSDCVGGWRDKWNGSLRARKRVLPVDRSFLGDGVKGQDEEGRVAGMRPGTRERERGERYQLSAANHSGDPGRPHEM